MSPEIQLDAHEARLFGVLVEKALTTPDQYPLTLNAAVNGANQKSNRDPVLSLSDEETSEALERLIEKELARKVFPGNSRVDKYCHTGTSTLKVEIQALAVLAELLLRGPQTPGELRQRVSRMVPIDSFEQLATILAPLRERGFVRRLAPQPGTRAERYVQELSPGLHPIEAPQQFPAVDPNEEASTAAPTLASRVSALESEVDRLRQQLQTLATKLGEPLD